MLNKYFRSAGRPLTQSPGFTVDFGARRGLRVRRHAEAWDRPAGGRGSAAAAAGTGRPPLRGQKSGLGARPGSLTGFALPPRVRLVTARVSGVRCLLELTGRLKGLLFVSGGPGAEDEHPWG